MGIRVCRKEYLKAFVHKEVGNHTVDAAAEIFRRY